MYLGSLLSIAVLSYHGIRASAATIPIANFRDYNLDTYGPPMECKLDFEQCLKVIETPEHRRPICLSSLTTLCHNSVALTKEKVAEISRVTMQANDKYHNLFVEFKKNLPLCVQAFKECTESAVPGPTNTAFFGCIKAVRPKCHAEQLHNRDLRICALEHQTAVNKAIMEACVEEVYHSDKLHDYDNTKPTPSEEELRKLDKLIENKPPRKRDCICTEDEEPSNNDEKEEPSEEQEEPVEQEEPPVEEEEPSEETQDAPNEQQDASDELKAKFGKCIMEWSTNHPCPFRPAKYTPFEPAKQDPYVGPGRVEDIPQSIEQPLADESGNWIPGGHYKRQFATTNLTTKSSPASNTSSTEGSQSQNKPESHVPQLLWPDLRPETIDPFPLSGPVPETPGPVVSPVPVSARLNQA